jgi:hypothetical protein
MKIILSSKRHHYVAKACTFLITAALITGMVGCGGYTPPSQDLEIRTWYDLDAVSDNLLRGNHVLMNNLDSTTAGYDELASATANGGKGWQPIEVLAGTLDGQGYEVCDLYINRPQESIVGLFGDVADGGRIEDIGMVNATVTGYVNVGSLVGLNQGTVSNSYSTGNITGDEEVGGLVGTNWGTVSSSYSTISVTGNRWIGGLIGISEGTVSDSYSSVSLTGDSYIGGLVGENDGTISNSYSSGSVRGNVSSTGGLIGVNPQNGTVNNSYSSASVTGYLTVGGLVGDESGTVTNSFWDTETSGQSTSGGGTGKTTAEMQDIATFSGAGWDIIAVAPGSTNTTYTWNIVNGVTYPFLSGES